MGFFHLPKSRKFNVPYRYYDPEKERLGRRIKEEGLPDFDNSVKGSFRGTTKKKTTLSSERSRSNVRLFLILTVLIFLAWAFLGDDFSFLTDFFK